MLGSDKALISLSNRQTDKLPSGGYICSCKLFCIMGL